MRLGRVRFAAWRRVLCATKRTLRGFNCAGRSEGAEIRGFATLGTRREGLG